MMRRYFGRATGTRRKRKPLPKFAILVVGTFCTFLLTVIVWYVNPGAHLPDEEKGSAEPTLVRPETSDDESSPGSEQPGTA
jgi:hypothetical protein